MAAQCVRSDWLEVQSKLLKLWERRFVVLQDDKLLVYKPGRPATEPGTLAFELRCDAIVNVAGPVGEDFRLRLELGPILGYNIRCFTKQRAMDWRKDILYRSCKKEK